MRETHQYSATNYVNENGFPLTWIIRLFTRRAASGIEEEAEECLQRNLKVKKIIGRPGGSEAWTGNTSQRQRT